MGACIHKFSSADIFSEICRNNHFRIRGHLVGGVGPGLNLAVMIIVDIIQIIREQPSVDDAILIFVYPMFYHLIYLMS